MEDLSSFQECIEVAAKPCTNVAKMKLIVKQATKTNYVLHVT